MPGYLLSHYVPLSFTNQALIDVALILVVMLKPLHDGIPQKAPHTTSDLGRAPLPQVLFTHLFSEGSCMIPHSFYVEGLTGTDKLYWSVPFKVLVLWHRES